MILWGCSMQNWVTFFQEFTLCLTNFSNWNNPLDWWWRKHWFVDCSSMRDVHIEMRWHSAMNFRLRCLNYCFMINYSWILVISVLVALFICNWWFLFNTNWTPHIVFTHRNGRFRIIDDMTLWDHFWLVSTWWWIVWRAMWRFFVKSCLHYWNHWFVDNIFNFVTSSSLIWVHSES